jgi:hypothetical protein
LAFDLVGEAHHGSFGDVCVLHQRRLDLGGAEAMAGDVDDVVDPTGDPVVPVAVSLGSITREVAAEGRRAQRERRPVGILQHLTKASHYRTPKYDTVAAGDSGVVWSRTAPGNRRSTPA